MKNKVPQQIFRLSKKIKFVIIYLFLLFGICILWLAAMTYFRGEYLYTIACLINVLIGLIIPVQCCLSSMFVYPDYCVIKSWNHPTGVIIQWEDIDEVYFRHHAILNNQKIVVKYRSKNNKLNTMVVLCDESNYIEDIVPYLKSNTRIRKY